VPGWYRLFPAVDECWRNHGETPHAAPSSLTTDWDPGVPEVAMTVDESGVDVCVPRISSAAVTSRVALLAVRS
jgi:hypothetical protein